jgi:DNA-binding NarL/FixJ family response regulator
MINILVVDDHQLMIDGIKTTLEDVEDLQVVSSASNGIEALKQLESNWDINVVLMDINMPEMDGLDCTKILHKKYPDIKIIALSQYSEKRFVRQMLKHGASGYLLKDAGKHDIINAIRAVLSGETFLPEELSKSLIGQSIKKTHNMGLFAELTSREKDILNMICNGSSSQEVADTLMISFHTVESHRSNMIAKTRAKNTAGLVRWAVENEFVD